jgi:hypothetical protein
MSLVNQPMLLAFGPGPGVRVRAAQVLPLAGKWNILDSCLKSRMAAFPAAFPALRHGEFAMLSATLTRWLTNRSPPLGRQCLRHPNVLRRLCGAGGYVASSQIPKESKAIGERNAT